MRVHRITLWTVACLALFPAIVQAVSPAALVAKGNRAYQADKYDDALKAYEKAGVDAVKSPQIDFNKGAVYFKKGDLKKAKDAWEKAALNSRDISLEAKALFNLGDCEFFEAKRLQDSDPQKAINACTRSIKYFQQALDLLKKPETDADASLKKDASENIEIVRLVMKSILDDMKKQQEQAKKQRQAADNLKKLIENQKALIDRNRQLADEKQDKGETEDLKQRISRMAKDQDDLRKETKQTADELKSSGRREPARAKAAKQHLDQAQAHQKSATEKINADDLAAAKKDQEAALEEMKKALASMGKPKGQNGQNKNGQTGNTQKARPEKADQKTREKPSDVKKQKNSEKQNMATANIPDDARSILDEEKANRKNRRLRLRSSGGYHAVEKDW